MQRWKPKEEKIYNIYCLGLKSKGLLSQTKEQTIV